MSKLRSPRLAILASGGGTTAQALAEGIEKGQLDAEIGLVISSKASAGVIDLAQKWNSGWGFDARIEVINNKTHPKGPRLRGQSLGASEAICELLTENKIDLVLQLGYMVIGNDPYISEWGFVPGRDKSVFDTKALNWHPGIVPLTADKRGAEASAIMLGAYNRGAIEKAGHTVHAVAQDVDGGPVFAETAVDIYPQDTETALFARVQVEEKAATPEIVSEFWRQQQEYRGLL